MHLSLYKCKYLYIRQLTERYFQIVGLDTDMLTTRLPPTLTRVGGQDPEMVSTCLHKTIHFQVLRLRP
ncbi:hypothetical protein [Echinococcus multilocularis]|uniref:Uncharacterized protein n=1 Tax=Echinococcus multilocularis TaxID=6211 RepID=A0A068YAP5_ECHMU|nr:hypothetical protein [Echinococcus multilocularis]